MLVAHATPCVTPRADARQVSIVERAGHYPFLDQPLLFLGQMLRQTAGVFPANAAAAAARSAAAEATPVRASSPQQISEWLDQWCAPARVVDAESSLLQVH